MEILGCKSGALGQYVVQKRQEAQEKMNKGMDEQLQILLKRGYHELCFEAREEFERCATSLKEAAAQCELRIARRVHPAVIMVPDALVSLQQKLRGIGSIDDRDLTMFGDELKLAELYLAINVERRWMENRQMLTETSWGEDQLTTMTLGETIMMATYYPALFCGVETVIMKPGCGLIAFLSDYDYQGGRKLQLMVEEFDRARKSWFSGERRKFQVMTCDFRLKR